jgi:hypothetical protein
MLFISLNGQPREVPVNRYRIDWDPEREVSGPQKAVKAFLRPYWEHKLVMEEMRIPGGKKRLDLICPEDGLIVEADGRQHDIYVPFLHGSKAGYCAAIKRDLEKDKFAEMNGFTLIRIKQDEIEAGLLSAAWVKETFGVTL